MMIESSDFIIHFSLLIPVNQTKLSTIYISSITTFIVSSNSKIIRRSQLRTQEIKFRFGVYLPAKRSNDSNQKNH